MKAADALALGDADVVARPSKRPSRPGASTSLERVSFSFASEDGARLAIDTANLHIEAGEFVCLVGPSGSGKSTILNLIAGLLAPSTGRVLANGRPIAGPGPERAMVFQDAALFPWLTLRDNVEYPLKLAGMSTGERRDRSDELLRMVHLYRFADAFPHQLSGGMRQRGAIARARDRSRRAPDGRAVRGARRTNARDPAGRGRADLPRDQEDGRVRHAQRPRGRAPRRPHRAHGNAPRTNSARRSDRSAALASVERRARGVVRRRRRERDQDRGRKDRQRGGGRCVGGSGGSRSR